MYIKAKDLEAKGWMRVTNPPDPKYRRIKKVKALGGTVRVTFADGETKQIPKTDIVYYEDREGWLV